MKKLKQDAAMEVDAFVAYLDSIPPLTGKKRRKLDKKEAKAKRKAEEQEAVKRKKDTSKKYQIRFNYSDVDGFYRDCAVLPAAAMWNMDEFLMAYIAAGLDGLLKGHTDWNWQDAPDAEMSTRKKLKRARNLAQSYVDAHTRMEETEKTIAAAAECLALISEIGVARLWD